MYVFTPYATENQLKANTDNYNVELISNDETIYRTEWKITRADGVYTYSLTKFGNDYHLRLDGEYEKFYCVFSMIDGENTVKVLKALINCYEEIRSMLTEDDSLYDSDIEVSIYDIQDRLNGGDTEEDDVDILLEEFYDLCDEVRIWVA